MEKLFKQAVVLLVKQAVLEEKLNIAHRSMVLPAHIRAKYLAQRDSVANKLKEIDEEFSKRGQTKEQEIEQDFHTEQVREQGGFVSDGPKNVVPVRTYQVEVYDTGD